MAQTHLPLGDIDSLTSEELEREIRRHNRLYWEEQSPEISDYDYDRLVERLKQLAPQAAVLFELGERRETLGAPVEHERPMLSLDKCYGEIDLNDWASKIEGDFVVMPKLDGLACSLRYDARGRLRLAATRGTGLVGDEITVNARHIRDIPQELALGNVEVRGEVFMRLSVFERYRGKYSNPRNLAAGAIKQKDAEKSADYQLSFAAYDLIGSGLGTETEKFDWLAAQGFPRMDLLQVPHGGLQKAYEDFAERRPHLDYEIDGVVFRANLVREQERLGSTAHHPRWALAYKFQGESGRTRLQSVEWSVSRTGAITPVGLIEPVQLSGAMVARASLHHPGYVRKLGLSKGCEVLVTRRGGVIPHIEKVLVAGSEPLPPPELCPSCQKPTRWENEDFLFCSEPTECPVAQVRELEHWCSVTEMMGFGERILTELFERRLVRTPVDLYTLRVEDLLGIERVGEKLAQKLVAQVQARRELPLSMFLRALGVSELGTHVSNLLAERYGDLASIRALKVEELAAIHTVGAIIAKSVVEGLAERSSLIDRLLEHLTLTQPKKVLSEGPFKGLSFVFTGKMESMDRKVAQARVRALGAETPSGVSAQLSYLVCGAEKDGAKSSKQKSAEKHIEKGASLQVLDEAGFLQLLKAHEG